jgi:hypothetical protein
MQPQLRLTVVPRANPFNVLPAYLDRRAVEKDRHIPTLLNLVARYLRRHPRRHSTRDRLQIADRILVETSEVLSQTARAGNLIEAQSRHARLVTPQTVHVPKSTIPRRQAVDRREQHLRIARPTLPRFQPHPVSQKPRKTNSLRDPSQVDAAPYGRQNLIREIDLDSIRPA